MSTKPETKPAAAKPAVKAAAKPAVKAETTKPVINGKPKATFKASAKPLYVPSPAVKLKPGQDVQVRSTRTGVKTKGRFVGKTTLDNSPGEWLKVNFAPKGKPAEIKHYRSAQVTAV